MSLSDLDTGLSIRCDRARELGRRAVAVDPWNPVTHLALVCSLLDDPTCVDGPATRPSPPRAGSRRRLSPDPRRAGRGSPPGAGPSRTGTRRTLRSLLDQALRIGRATSRRASCSPCSTTSTAGATSLRGLAALLAEDPSDPTTHAMLRAWLVGTSLTWSVGLGVLTLAELWSLLSDPPVRAPSPRGSAGWLLAAASVRATSANLCQRGSGAHRGAGRRADPLSHDGPAWRQPCCWPWRRGSTCSPAPVVGAGVLLVVGAVTAPGRAGATSSSARRSTPPDWSGRVTRWRSWRSNPA